MVVLLVIVYLCVINANRFEVFIKGDGVSVCLYVCVQV